MILRVTALDKQGNELTVQAVGLPRGTDMAVLQVGTSKKWFATLTEDELVAVSSMRPSLVTKRGRKLPLEEQIEEIMEEANPVRSAKKKRRSVDMDRD